MKVKDAIQNLNERDYKKKLQLIEVKERIVKDISDAKEKLKQYTKELEKFENCSYKKIKIKYDYTTGVRTFRWVCGIKKGEERVYY